MLQFLFEYLCENMFYSVLYLFKNSVFFLLLEWQYVVIAQACDIDTSIGLARSHNASPYFFLPPPFRDLDQVKLN